MEAGADFYDLSVEMHFRRHAKWHVDKKMQLVIPLEPTDHQRPFDGIDHAMDAHKLAREVRRDADFPATGRNRLDTSQKRIEPMIYRTVHGMAVGVHARVLLQFETLPNGRRFLLNRIAVGRIILRRDERPRVIDVAVLAQHFEEIACAEVARRELVVPLTQFVAQFFRGLRGICFGEDAQP